MAANPSPYGALGVPAIKTPYLKKFQNFSNIASNTIASITIPPVGTFYSLYFRFLTGAGAELTKANIESQVANVSVRINGELIIDATAAELNMLHKFYGDAKAADVVDGILKIDFARGNLTLPLEKWQYAIGTVGINSIEVQMRLGTVTNLAQVEVFAYLTDEERPIGPHVRIMADTLTHGAASPHEYPSLPLQPGTAYLALHIGLGAGTLTETSLILDDVQFVHSAPASVLQALLEHHKRNPQTGYRHLSFDVFDEVLGFLPLLKANGTQVKDFRLRNVWTVAPTTHRVIHERVYGLKVPA